LLSFVGTEAVDADLWELAKPAERFASKTGLSTDLPFSHRADGHSSQRDWCQNGGSALARSYRVSWPADGGAIRQL
jgi:hypothetical protein